MYKGGYCPNCAWRMLAMANNIDCILANYDIASALYRDNHTGNSTTSIFYK